MLRKLLAFAVLCLATVSLGFAQSGSIQGTVTDSESGEPLPSTNIFIVELERGTSTDANGEFELEDVPAGTYTLRATYIGYTEYTQQVEVGNDVVTLDIQMTPTAQQLEDVVVTGYQTRTQEESSISASSVSSEDLNTVPSSTPAQALTGKVPGLNITTSSGQPGADPQMNLRGVSSLTGQTEPLILLDGAPINKDNFASLNPDIIQNVTVLKDVGATAIYGNRGANGVILIETKTGEYGQGIQVSYSGQVKSTSLRDSDYDLLTGPQQLGLEQAVLGGNFLGIDPGPDFSFTPGEGFDDLGNLSQAPTTDWVDHFFNPTLSQQHTLSVSTGRENLRTYTSFGFTNQDGALDGSRLRRWNIQNNISGRSDDRDFNYAVNTSINFNNDRSLTSIGTSGINQNPLLAAKESVPYLTPEDYPGSGAGLLALGVPFTNTPLYIMDKQKYAKNGDRRLKLSSSVRGSYQLTEGLEANLQLGGDYERNDGRYMLDPRSFNAILFAEAGNNYPGQQDYGTTESFTYDLSTNLQYQFQFNEIHEIDAGAYFEMNQGFYEFGGFNSQGIIAKTNAFGDGGGFVPDNSLNDFHVDPISLNKLRSGLLSYFGTADYSYADRYGASVTVRRDASYRFSGDNEWGTFYAFSARWNIANESFMDDSPFDVLKLRASYGKTGNQNITGASGQFTYFGGNSLTQDLYNTTAQYQGIIASAFSQLGNRSLKWEEVIGRNVGIDAELFNSRLVASVDLYIRETQDLFQNRPISAVVGQTSINTNIGALENRGIEFDVSYDFIRSRDGFNLTVGVLGAHNKQEILDLPGGEPVVSGLTVLREGGPINEFYVYPYEGVNPDNGNLLFRDADGNITESPSPADDRRYTGKNIYPDLEGSINVDMSYKGIYLRSQWQYVLGTDRFDFRQANLVDPTSIGQFQHSEDMLDFWTPNNQDASQPAITAGNRSLDDFSDRFLTSSDYFRLRQLSLGYQFPASVVEKVNLRGARIFVTGENVITLTSWKDLDPETLNPTNSRLYPNPRIFTMGLEVEI